MPKPIQLNYGPTDSRELKRYKLSPQGHFAVYKLHKYDCVHAVHVPSGSRAATFSHLSITTLKQALEGLGEVESATPAALNTLKTEPTDHAALIVVRDAFRKHFGRAFV